MSTPPPTRLNGAVATPSDAQRVMSNTPPTSVERLSAGAPPTAADKSRGRTATRPQHIPARGWWDITLRVKDNLDRDNAALISSGLAMYALLAVFPGLAATMFIYGLFASPAQLIHQLGAFSSQMPPGVWAIFQSQLQAIASRQQGALSAGAAVSLLVALYSARSGMGSLMTVANIAYREEEKRSLVRQIGISLLLTVGAVAGFVLMLLLALAVPLVMEVLGVTAWMQMGAEALRWVLLWGIAVLGLAVVYRFAPAREPARWHWVTWGSGIAATVWLIGSVLFSFYVRTFGSYQKTYGTLGSVVVLLLWFYLSSFAVVLGAEINAESERQTIRDTTTGSPEPLGERGAIAADTVGPAANERRH